MLSFDSLLPSSAGASSSITLWCHSSSRQRLHSYACSLLRDERAIALPRFFVRARPRNEQGMVPLLAHPAPVLWRMSHIWPNSTPVQWRPAISMHIFFIMHYPNSGRRLHLFSIVLPTPAAWLEKQNHHHSGRRSRWRAVHASLSGLAPPQRQSGSGSFILMPRRPDGLAASSRLTGIIPLWHPGGSVLHNSHLALPRRRAARPRSTLLVPL